MTLVGHPKQRTVRPSSCQRAQPSAEIDVVVSGDRNSRRVSGVGGILGGFDVAGACEASSIAVVLALTPIFPVYSGGKATFRPSPEISSPTPSSESFAKRHGTGLAQIRPTHPVADDACGQRLPGAILAPMPPRVVRTLWPSLVVAGLVVAGAFGPVAVRAARDGANSWGAAHAIPSAATYSDAALASVVSYLYPRGSVRPARIRSGIPGSTAARGRRQRPSLRRSRPNTPPRR